MGKDGRGLVRCKIDWPALAYRVAKATGLLDKRLLWLLTADNAPEIGTNLPSEIVPSKRVRVGMVHGEISESFANVRYYFKLEKFTRKGYRTYDFRPKHFPRYNVSYKILLYTRSLESLQSSLPTMPS